MFVPLDGSPRRTLFTDYHEGARRLDDGLRVGVEHPDAQHIGALVLLDPVTRTRRTIDDRVVDGTFAETTAATGEEGVIVYSVSDGDRSGAWLARPLPEP